MNIKTYLDEAIAQATSVAAKVGYVSANMTQLVTPGSLRSLYAIRRAQNTGDQNIGVLQQTLTRLCNLVVTLEQKIHHLSQNGTAQFIKGI